MVIQTIQCLYLERVQLSKNCKSPSKFSRQMRTSRRLAGFFFADPGTWRYKAFDCPKCQRHIWAPMMEQEHNDWHLAVELSKVEEGPDPSATRKRLTLSNASKKPAKKSKTSPLTLDHFFKKKSA